MTSFISNKTCDLLFKNNVERKMCIVTMQCEKIKTMNYMQHTLMYVLNLKVHEPSMTHNVLISHSIVILHKNVKFFLKHWVGYRRTLTIMPSTNSGKNNRYIWSRREIYKLFMCIYRGSSLSPPFEFTSWYWHYQVNFLALYSPYFFLNYLLLQIRSFVSPLSCTLEVWSKKT